jgi:ABC-type molybdate transport system substrate-binding protein
MLERLGLASAIAEKVTIVQTGAAVMDHLVSRAPDLSIGFGHVTEIRLHDDKGTHLVGVLPAAIGRETMYAAAVLSSAAAPDPASQFVAGLASERARTMFASTGVIPPGGDGRAGPASG